MPTITLVLGYLNVLTPIKQTSIKNLVETHLIPDHGINIYMLKNNRKECMCPHTGEGFYRDMWKLMWHPYSRCRATCVNSILLNAPHTEFICRNKLAHTGLHIDIHICTSLCREPCISYLFFQVFWTTIYIYVVLTGEMVFIENICLFSKQRKLHKVVTLTMV